MANRFPLVIDTTNENKISELPTGDNLNLTGSDISAVNDIYVSGTIFTNTGEAYNTFSGDYNDLANKPVLFSGDYTELANKPTIPGVLTDLNILDGLDGQVLTTDGNGNFSFAESTVSNYNDLVNKPVIPATLIDLGIQDGGANQYLKSNGNGTFEFDTLSAIQSYTYSANQMATIAADMVLIPGSGQNLKINSATSLILPVGDTLARGVDIQGGIRFNTEGGVFEGYDGTNWRGLGGVVDVDQDTFIRAEVSSGSDEDTIQFFTGGQGSATLSSTQFALDSNVDTILQATTATTTSTTGALTVAGGVGIAGGIVVDGTVNQTNTTQSNSTVTGALTTVGGAGIGKNLYVGGNSVVSGNQTIQGNVNVTGLISVEGAFVLGQAAEPSAEFNATIASDIIPGLNDTYDLGNNLLKWRQVNASRLDLDSIRIDDDTISVTNTNASLILRPAGTGNVEIDSDQGLILPLGNNASRPAGTIGMVRFNSEDTIFEGYDGIAWGSLGGVKDVDQDTYISAETSPGADNDELRFYTQDNLKATLSDTLFDVDVDTQINQIQLSGNTISTFENNDDINITPNGTGEVVTPSLTVSDLTDTRITFSGTNGSLTDNANLTYDGSNLEITGNVKPQTDAAGDLGTDSERWATAYIDSIQVTDDVTINDYTMPTADGTVNQMMKTDGAGAVTFVNPDAFGGNRVYVSKALGSDDNDGITAPTLTIKRAAQIATSLVYTPTTTDPTTETETAALRAAAQTIADATIVWINTTYPSLTYNQAKCNRDVKEIIDSAIYDLRFGGNSRSVTAGKFYYDANGNTYISGQETETAAAVGYAKSLAVTYLTGSRATAIGASFDIVSNIITSLGAAPTEVYPTNVTKNQITIQVASGDYTEETFILADNVSLIGDNLRRVIIRPAVAQQDGVRVRNSSYITGVVFRDHLDGTGIPDFTHRFCISFDSPFDTSVSRAGYTNLTVEKAVIFTSPYVQNCSVISFIGAGGVEIDGTLVDTPNVPSNPEEAEFPAIGDVPEQGKSMVSNAFTILSFDGVAWRVVNDAYAQIVSCFVIFTQQGCLTQNGGYLSITNSASNFGLFALRSSGYSQSSFDFNRGVVSGTGTIDANQTLTVIGLGEPALEHYVAEVFDASATSFNLEGNALRITDSFTLDSQDGITFQITPANVLISGNTMSFYTAPDFITPANQPFVDGDVITYLAKGNPEAGGIYNELTYYVSDVTSNRIGLYHDEDYTNPVTRLSFANTSGTHEFRKGYEHIIIQEVVSTHNDYQEVVLPAGTFTPVIGDSISGTSVGGDNIVASILSYDAAGAGGPTLIVSNELVQEGVTQVRRKFSPGDQILTAEIGNAGAVSVQTVNAINNLYTSTFKVATSRSNAVSNISNMAPGVGTPGKKLNLHRPSITNSSSHTWEYAGSGIDYNALPQNGGQTISFYEQVDTLPGRVYTSGTNELGDFKVGKFVVAFNRTGNIEFKNKVTVGLLDSLALSLSSGVEVNEISTDIELGDNEVGGASDSRLVTQRAARKFLDNRLGAFIDQNVSTNSVPNAVTQLDSSGKLSPDVIPPTGLFTSYEDDEFEGRLELHLQIPPNKLNAGDIAVERYSQVTLTLSVASTVAKGTIITQLNTGATGEVKQDLTNATNLIVVNVAGTFSNSSSDTIAAITGTPYPTVVSSETTETDNYFLANNKSSQMLILDESLTYDFTNIIANDTALVGSVSGAVISEVTSHDVGVLITINFVGFNGGTEYIASGNVTNVPFTNITGSGSGATADMNVVAGTIDTVDIITGGTGYAVGDQLSVADSSLGGQGGTGADAVFIVTDVQNRLFTTLNQAVGLVFAPSDSNPDFLVDDSPTTITIADLTVEQTTNVDARDTGSGGNIDAANSRFNISSHGLSDGDPVLYDTNSNISLGGLANGNTYFVKVIDVNNFDLYTDYGVTTQKLTISSTSTGTHFLKRQTVNTESNRFYKAAHGITTGQAVRLDGTDVPSGLFDEQRVFVGGVTTNSFQVHTSRGSALSSLNGLQVAPTELADTGSGSLALEIQNVVVKDVVNTSGRDNINWSSLSTATIDAGNIISGVIETSRLGTGSANNLTFLRGDSQFVEAVQGIQTPALIAGQTNPITLQGSNYEEPATPGTFSFYNKPEISIEVASTSSPGGTPQELLGLARFDFDYFNVDSTGKVTTKDAADGGAIDSDTLDGRQGSFYQNPINLTSAVPLNKGGTYITSYNKGDIIYAGAVVGAANTDTLSKLAIGTNGDILRVGSTGIPEWGNDIILGNIRVGVTDDNTIDTTTGDLKLDAATNLVVVNDNFSVNGNTTLGNANSDTITLTGKVTSSILFTDTNNDIGDTTNQARDIYLNRNLNFEGTNGTNQIIVPTNQADALTIKDDAGTPVELMVFTTTTGSPKVTIKGDLQVDGSTTTVNSTTVTVDDPIFTLGGDTAPASDDNKDRGIEYRWHNGTAAKKGFFGYDDSGSVFTFIPDATNTSEVFSGTAGNVVFGEGTFTGGKFGNVKIGQTGDNEIDTSTGNLTIDSAGGTVTVDDNLTVSGTTTLNGNVTLGDAAADLITLTGTIQGGTPLRFEGPTANGFETSITITEPTADRSINIPNAGGTFAVAGSSTTTQSALDISVSAAGAISGSAEGLGTADTPTFESLVLTDGTNAITFEGDTDNSFETRITVVDPTADRAINIPDADGTVVVSAGTSTTQSGLDLAISAAGNLTGSAEGLATTDSPQFVGLTLTGALNVQGNTTLGNATSDTVTINGTLAGATPLRFEGATANTFETRFDVVNPTADRIINIPDASGTFAVSAGTSSTQSGLDLAISASGQISGSAEGLATTDTPTFGGLILSSATSSAPVLTLTNSNADAQGPTVRIGKTTTGEADNDDLADIEFFGKDSGNVEQTWASIKVESDDITNTTRDSSFQFTTYSANSFSNSLVVGNGIQVPRGEVYLGAGVDIRFEGTTDNTFETTLDGGEPTADRSISLPNASGTVALLSDITGGGTGAFSSLAIDTSIVFEGSSADANETTLTVVNPTADRTINIPNNSGTMAVAGGTASTTTQSALDTATSISATGVITTSGSAEGLGTADTPTFGNLTLSRSGTTTLNMYNNTSGSTGGLIRSRLSSTTPANGDVILNILAEGRTSVQSERPYAEIEFISDVVNSATAAGKISFRTLRNGTTDTGEKMRIEGSNVVITAPNFLTQGTTTLGDAATDTTTLTGRINSDIIPNSTSGAYSLGSSSRPWGTVYGTATSAQYADLAEIYATDQTYKPGTVVMFGGDQEVTAAYPQATRKVAGVISTDPAYLMNSAAEGQPIALKGRVPCYVIGAVEKGDLLIASNTAGVAMVSEEYIGGAVIGKAIEASNDPGIKIIEIAVGVL